MPAGDCEGPGAVGAEALLNTGEPCRWWRERAGAEEVGRAVLGVCLSRGEKASPASAAQLNMGREGKGCGGEEICHGWKNGIPCGGLHGGGEVSATVWSDKVLDMRGMVAEALWWRWCAIGRG